MHELFNTSMHAVPSNYRRMEQNGEALRNPSLYIVLASYSLQTPGSQLLRAVRVHHHNMISRMKLWSRSTYSIAIACSSCSWPHIYMVALPWQLLPIIVIATHTQFNRQPLILLSISDTSWDVSENFALQNIYLCITFSR